MSIRDGVVIVTDPTGDGNLAAIVAGPGVVVEVNGHAADAAAVSQGDEVRVRVEHPDETTPVQYEVSLSDDGLEARLSVRPGTRVRRLLVDAAPAARVEAVAEEVRSLLPPDPAAARAALARAGVTVGIDEEALAGLAEAEAPVAVVAARGRAPLPGTPSRFLPCGPDIERAMRGHTDVLVAAGRLLGRVEPAVPGRAGLSVTGRDLPPPDADGPHVEFGPGIRVDADHAYACTDGRLAVTGEGGRQRIAVAPVILFAGDVDHRELAPEGKDVLVRGATERIRAEGVGTFHCEGAVSQSHVRTSGDVHTAGGLVHSTILAGERSPALAMWPDLSDLARSLTTVRRAHDEIARSNMVDRDDWRRRGVRAVLNTLLRTRLRDMPDVLQRLAELAPLADGDTRRLALAMRDMVLGDAPVSLEDLETAIRTVEGKANELAAATPGKLCAEVQAAIHSTLACDGDVHVLRGCERSLVVSARTVVSDGAVRGGTIWAAGDVIVRTIGSPYQPDTRVVSVSGRIWAETVHPGATLEVAGHVFVTESERRNCCIAAGAKGITVEPARTGALVDRHLAGSRDRP